MSFPLSLKRFLVHILQSKFAGRKLLSFYSCDNDYFTSFLKGIFARHIIIG